MTALSAKLGIKPGFRLLVLEAPEGYLALLAPPEGATVATQPTGAVDHIQAFVRTKADIDRLAPAVLALATQKTPLWFCYPKKTGAIATDIHRDVGWDALAAAGWRPVSLVSIDDTWSAFRFKPIADVKTAKRG